MLHACTACIYACTYIHIHIWVCVCITSPHLVCPVSSDSLCSQFFKCKSRSTFPHQSLFIKITFYFGSLSAARQICQSHSFFLFPFFPPPTRIFPGRILCTVMMSRHLHRVQPSDQPRLLGCWNVSKRDLGPSLGTCNANVRGSHSCARPPPHPPTSPRVQQSHSCVKRSDSHGRMST